MVSRTQIKSVAVFCLLLHVFSVSLKAGEGVAEIGAPSYGVAKPVSLSSNINPSKGMFGITAGAIQSLAGDGQVFGGTPDAPHSDFGLIFGFDYWKKNLNSLDFHVGLNAKYLQYHFHYAPTPSEDITGRLRMLYYSIPFSVHLQIPNYSFLQLIGGAAITGMNLLPAQSGIVGDYSYQSLVNLKFVVSPELFVGINFLEEKTDYFILRGSINYSSFLLRNQSFGVSLSSPTEDLSTARRMGSSKFELYITIYPKWRFKNALGKDEGINCPSPF